MNPLNIQLFTLNNFNQIIFFYISLLISSFAFAEGASIQIWSPNSSSKSRRGILRRAVFSEEQRKELERTFRRQKYISKTDRNKLAADLNLKESQVIKQLISVILIGTSVAKENIFISYTSEDS